MSRFDDGGRDLAVMRRDDQNVHALRQKVFALLDLNGVTAVRHLHFTLRADFFAALLDQSLVALPALFLQSVHRKADAHWAAGFGATAGVG
jgi:hypothetical protein